MKDLIQSAMDYAKSLDVDYADIRYKDILKEDISVENSQLTETSNSRSQGYGVRVYVDGAMGFAASSDMTQMNETVKKAYEIARTSLTLLKEKVQLDKKEAVQATHETPVVKDPFAIPFAEKLALLMECDKNMRGTEGVTRTLSSLMFRKDDVIFADTDGSYIDQKFCQSGAVLEATAISDTDTQERSFTDLKRAGYETILNMNLIKLAATLGKEAVALLHAEDCPSGEFDVILMPRQMFLQIHESVGHPTELDRILGSEAAFAGRSFVETENLTTKPLTYGSEHVTIVADATCPLGLGTFAYDDEGVAGQNVTLIDKGKFVGLQTSRDNASKIGQNSSGGGLSDGWRNLPIVRMTNINLLPGDFTLDTLIAGIEYGFVFDQNKSWSIDDLRVNFQFACEIAREVKDGKLTGRVFKNPIYAGKTTDFWASCDGTANKDFWEIIGTPNCGKGQPMQIMRVSHGSSPTRFRKVKVGVDHVE
ncbi:MAG: TldD/PmbA family protein [Defluviitaleaceae bacterium]|nr:TldD/PmbA family protein [Defluviitaleaceae bacterium]